MCCSFRTTKNSCTQPSRTKWGNEGGKFVGVGDQQLSKAHTDIWRHTTTDKTDTYLHCSVENCGCFASKLFKFGIHRVKIHLFREPEMSRPQIDETNVQNFRFSALNVPFKYFCVWDKKYIASQSLFISKTKVQNVGKLQTLSVTKLIYWVRTCFVAKKMSQNGAWSFPSVGPMSLTVMA